jgi:citrate synthase
MKSNSLTIIDRRTGREYETPIESETIKAVDLRKIKEKPEDFGLMTYDPGFMNTACCRSSITYIDGDRGILLHRGYPIDQLAHYYSHLQVAYLILWGTLPNEDQTRGWQEGRGFPCRTDSPHCPLRGGNYARVCRSDRENDLLPGRRPRRRS